MRYSIIFMALAIVACSPGSLFMKAGSQATTTVSERRSFKTTANDTRILLDVTDHLFKHKHTYVTDVNVTVYEGRVMLNGALPSTEEIAKVIELVWKAEGVAEVINELRTTQPDGMYDTGKDALLATELRAKLAVNRDIASSNFKVVIEDLIVYLLGRARDTAEMESVIAEARTIGGIRRIVSHVQIGEAASEPVVTPVAETAHDS